MPGRPWRRGACVLSAFVLLAVLQSWPLPVALATHLTGPPAGDTGVYVWNTWVLRHELVADHRLPFRTVEVLPLDGPTDLSLHNYTLASNLLALPLQPLLGVVASFNVVYLVNIALAGFGLYLLARRVTGRTVESLLAGCVFACSPFLVTRSMAHFSLVAAAPLPLFMLCLLRTWEHRRIRDAAAAGAVLAWAAFCDPYYAVYCVILAIGLVAVRLVAVRSSPRPADDLRAVKLLLSSAIVGTTIVILAVRGLGGGQLEFASMRISMRTLYTPMFLLTILVIARVVASRVVRWARRPLPDLRWLAGAALAGSLVATVLLTPNLIGLAQRALDGRLVAAPVLWRSSAPGVDLLSLLSPNPNHPFAPQALVDWLASRPNRYEDQVASLSWVGLALMVFAWRRAGWTPRRGWVLLTVAFALLSLGPFIQIAGVNTYVPTPWSLLRYVPLVGAARMPSRMAVVTTMGFCVLLAFALAAITTRYARYRRAILAAVAVALACELVPVPRTLHSAEIPAVYQIIRRDPRPVRVLELPTGIRDGLSSMGDFSASAMFHQTFHEKGLIGGYLSRVSLTAKAFHRRLPVLDALMTLAERQPLSPHQLEHARRAAPEFVRRARIGYVVFRTDQITPELRALALDIFQLTLVQVDGARELYVTRLDME